MLWNKLLTSKRFGLEKYYDKKYNYRTEYQRDYDRLIFSAPFRRLQNKTQVFPLPGSIFVHNRLTHSIEVASVGRSLGNRIGKALCQKYYSNIFEDIESIISAACLAHDLGNPPFGHSGEKAISSFFLEGNGKCLKSDVEKSNGRWSDFTSFDGNANAIRLLTNKFNGKREGGFTITYPTIASIVKYPYSSELSNGKNKFGFFLSEEKNYKKIADDLGIIVNCKEPLSLSRYPLTFLVEAADDICYQIMDIEDSHKLGIISTKDTIELFLNFFDKKIINQKKKILSLVSDSNEQIAYLRSSVIGILIDECSKSFLENEENILKGKFTKPLISCSSPNVNKAYEECSSFASENIYRTQIVVDVELAGHQILGFLLDKYIDAVINPSNHYSKLLLDRIPLQYDVRNDNIYNKILSIVDYISGMTDIYALDIYQKITGYKLSKL